MNNTKQVLTYGIFYMHKLYEHIGKLQESKHIEAQDFYFIDEKLMCFLAGIERIGLEKFKNECRGICIKDLLDEHYMNIS